MTTKCGLFYFVGLYKWEPRNALIERKEEKKVAESAANARSNACSCTRIDK
jgi:hypothetical protein